MIPKAKPLVQSFYKLMFKLKPNHPQIPFEFYHAPLFLNKFPVTWRHIRPFSFSGTGTLKDDIYKDGK